MENEIKDIFEREAELRYPVKTHVTPDNSPYDGAKITFLHGCRFGYAIAKENETTHDVSQNRYSKEDILNAVDLGLTLSTVTKEPFTSPEFKLLKEIFINGFLQSISPITETKTNGDAEEGRDLIENIAIDFTNNQLKIVSGLLSDDYKIGFKEGVENYIEWQKKQPHT